MKHLIPKTMTAVPVLALALAVGGCGSSSDDDDMMADAGPTPQQRCEMGGGRWNADMTCTSADDVAMEQRRDTQRTAISNAITAAETAVAMVGNDSTDDDVKAAEDAIADARNAIMAAADVPTTETAANTGTVNAIEGRLTAAKTARMTAMDDAAKAAAEDAMALFNGFADAGADGNADLVLGTLTVMDEHGGSATVSADGAGGTPAVEATDTTVPMLGMWKGTELTGDTSGEMPSNTVVVYTDIAAPKATAFGDVYTLDTNGNFGGTSGDADAWLQHADNRSKIMAADFMHTGRMDHDPDPAATDDVVMIRGTFNGASGEFRCLAATPTSCASHDAADDSVRLEGAWVFDPDSGAMAMMADASYAYFGWWLHKAGGEATPEVVAFHGVTDGSTPAALAAPTDMNALGGMATYEGAAAGKYAINPGLSTASGGHWTADATLTADFGSETAAGTISGMVESFMADGQMMDWNVALGATVLSGTGVFNTGTDTTDDTGSNAVVWTIGGVDGAEAGAWSGGLRAEGDNNVPTLATGMFSATHGTVGHMVGAFGTHLEE